MTLSDIDFSHILKNLKYAWCKDWLESYTSVIVLDHSVISQQGSAKPKTT